MSDEEQFPPAIRGFIRRHLRSVEQLEILLLLQDRAHDDWTVQSVYAVIRSSTGSVERWLNEFVQLGFVSLREGATPSYRYAATGGTAVDIQAFADFYRLKPARVLEAIFQRGDDPARSFADAFRIKRQNP